MHRFSPTSHLDARGVDAAPWHRPGLWGLLVCALLSLVSRGARSKERAFAPHEVMAAFAMRAATFTTWDGEAPQQEAFVLGLIGRDAVSDYLADNAAQLGVKGQAVEVVSLGAAPPPGPIHMLWVAADGRAQLPEALARLGPRPVLTVGSGADFAEHGGCLGLYVQREHLAYVVNLDACRSQGVMPRSPLLARAERVLGVPGGRP